MRTDLTDLCIEVDHTIHDAVAQMDRSRVGIVMVVTGDRKLLGTITEGDVRRAILASVNLDDSLALLLERKVGTEYASPVTLNVESSRTSRLKVMQQNNIRLLPILNSEDQVVGLVTLDEFVTPAGHLTEALIMAGGMGVRMRPLTNDLPKPMLPVGDRPLMEIIVEKLKTAGIQQVNVALHFQPEKIKYHFGDGTDFGVKIDYFSEEEPLGTAGALGLLEVPEKTLLVINGDILTDIDFNAMMAFHMDYQADLTLAVHRYDLQVPYGVVDCDDAFVQSLTEKPTIKSLVNAGIYLLEPSVFDRIPKGYPLDMTALIQELVMAGRPVVAFPIRESWLDIGHPADYVQAQQDVKITKEEG